MNDKALLQRWMTERDAEAFHELVNRHARMVYAAAHRVLTNRHDAEDVTQECFEKLARSRRVPGTYLAAWLHRMAVNKGLDRIKGDMRRRARNQTYQQNQTPVEACGWEDIYPVLDEIVDALPTKEQEAIVAHFFMNDSHTDIAKQAGVSRQAVAQRIQKGLSRIREQFRKRGITLSVAVLSGMLTAKLADAQPLSQALLKRLGQIALAGQAASPILIAGGLGLKAILTSLAIMIVGGAYLTLRQTTTDDHVPPENVPAISPKGVGDLAEKEAPPSVTNNNVVETALATEVVPPSLAAAPEMGSISGRVVDEDTGEGVPEAGVLLKTREQRWPEQKTDASGAFRFAELPPNTYALFPCGANGYSLNSEEDMERKMQLIELRAGQNKEDVTIAMSKGRSISGAVIDVDGRPVAAATVHAGAEYMNDPVHQLSTTDDSGKFTLTGLPEISQLYLWAEKEQFVSETLGPVTVPYAEEAPVELILYPEAALCGKVVDKNGRSLPNISVGVQFQKHRAKRKAKTTSDAHGQFEIRALPPMQALLLAYDDTNIISDGVSFEVGPGETMDNIILQCYRGGLAITGQITNEVNGAPVANADIVAHSLASDSTANDRSGNDGTFKLEGLETGPYLIEVTHSFWRSAVSREVPAGTAEADFSLRKPYILEGRVLRADDSTPIERFTVERLYDGFPLLAGADTRVNPHPNGHFTLTFAKEGKTRVYVLAPGFSPAYQDITFDADTEEPLQAEFLLETGKDLRGVVLDVDGEPIAGAKIMPGSVADTKIDDSLGAQSKGDGTFVLPAQWRLFDEVSIYHPEYGPVTVSTYGDTGALDYVEIILNVGSEVACSLTVDGERMTDVRYTLVDPSDTSIERKANAYGTYTFSRLTAGLYELHAYTRFGDSRGLSMVRKVQLDANQHLEIPLVYQSGNAALRIEPIDGATIQHCEVHINLGDVTNILWWGHPRISPQKQQNILFKDLPLDTSSEETEVWFLVLLVDIKNPEQPPFGKTYQAYLTPNNITCVDVGFQ